MKWLFLYSSACQGCWTHWQLVSERVSEISVPRYIFVSALRALLLDNLVTMCDIKGLSPWNRSRGRHKDTGKARLFLNQRTCNRGEPERVSLPMTDDSSLFFPKVLDTVCSNPFAYWFIQKIEALCTGEKCRAYNAILGSELVLKTSLFIWCEKIEHKWSYGRLQSDPVPGRTA